MSEAPVLPSSAIAARNALALLVILGAHSALFAGSPGGQPSDLEVKAAFVLNFIRLTTWASDGEGESSGLTVCALSNSDFASAVRRVVTGKTAGDRLISFRIDHAPDPSRCNVLVVDATQYRAARAALASARRAPMLTVGNGPGFLALGGMFQLTVEEQKVQFCVDLDAVRASGLNVSARLLLLARNVRKAGGSD
jgi:hypothetical protein